MYFDYSKVMSYNSFLNFLIGERGCGKTYGATKLVVKQFLKKKEEFVYIRRYKTELQKSVKNFFSPLINNDEFKDHDFKTKGNEFYIDDKISGYAMTLTTAQNMKSSNFPGVKNIIFDEFILENGTRHYLKNEVEIFLGLIETIARMRDVRIFCLGNAVSITNPYFTYFDLSLPYNNDIKTFKDGLILVNYMKNNEYRENKKKTKFGKLIENTEFANYIIDNDFRMDNKDFIEKKSSSAKFSFAFIYENKTYGVWLDYKLGKVFVSNDFINNGMLFAMTKDDLKPNTMLLSAVKDLYAWKTFIKNYKLGNLYFENIKIKNICLTLLSLLNRY